MTTEKNSPHELNFAEEELVARRLAPLDETAAPFQPEIADRVKAFGAELLSQSAPAHVPVQSVPSQSVPSDPVPSSNLFRRRSMLTKTLIAMSALLSTLIWCFSQGPLRGEITLGTVLDRTAAAQSLHLKITKDGRTANVWVREPGQVRWEESPTEYEITAGHRLWQIDENANTYQTGTTDWYDDAEKQVNLLALIGLNEKDAARFREVQSKRVVDREGRHCRVFRMTTSDRNRPVLIEAVADAQTGELQTLALWPAGRRQGAPLAELALVARDVPVDESKFAVAKSLSEDGRIGKLTDSQGLVSLRPKLSKRWTPVCRQMLVKPGDWLRTDVRGANASTAFLTSQYQLIAGPGTLIELQTPHRVRIACRRDQDHRNRNRRAFPGAARSQQSNRDRGQGPVGPLRPQPGRHVSESRQDARLAGGV